MIPKELKRYHFSKAAKEIDKNGVPKSRESYVYDLVLNGKLYPPKYVISIANKYLAGTEFLPTKFNAVEAKDYFIKNGYRVLDKKNNERISKIVGEDEESSFSEGKERYKLHKKLERDQNITKKAKELRLDTVGELSCDVCRFSFADTYGELGAGFIEAHHTIPVSQIKGGKKTKIEEIALVCSNCHRIIHLSNPLLSIEELRKVIEENN